MKQYLKHIAGWWGLLLFTVTFSYGQPCTNLGQTPSTAFPVCGTTIFHQSIVPLCSTVSIFVPGCTGQSNANYQNKNPYFYKFTCYVSGTLGFLIKPLVANEDYDWQLWDITGRNPNDIFTDPSLVVAGNWSGSYGNTGASATGTTGIQCASLPTDNAPTFAQMPNLTAGHEYLLMISHWTDTQSGYDLSFGGGTAVITDPKVPAMDKVVPDCNGQLLTLSLNKKIRCSSLSVDGTEFIVLPDNISATASVAAACANGFDFDELDITLGGTLSSGTHQLVIKNGSDGNTLSDLCDNLISPGQSISFDYIIPHPIRADSVGKTACATDTVLVYYPKKIRCSSITASGADFTISGPTPVTVTGASGNCTNDQTEYFKLKLASPLYTKGTYTVSIQPGIDGSPIFDVCGQPILPQSLTFITADTVNADFQYHLLFGCQRDTLIFSHNGAHDVNSWIWNFNDLPPVTTQTHTIVFPAASTNNVRLMVSNGTCSAISSQVVTLDNEVKAIFSTDNIICPEDRLAVTNMSTGHIDIWKWTYDVIGTSNLENPPPFLFPTINREAYYTVKLTVTNSTLGCSDSTRHTLTVLDHCFIDVPTAFTPNNDGLNDYFRPHNALKADNYEFRVYNRWGQLVFHSRNWQDKWDGKINGQVQPTGVYVWFLTYTNRDTKQPVFKKGTVTLIR